jgi:hypothetical protein
MKVLKPNTGEDCIPIMKNNLFVRITDYGNKTFLKEIIVSLGQHHWEWIELSTARAINIGNIGSKYCSFDNAINRAVNDSYCTVYEMTDVNELIANWNAIEYIDNITTIYRSR